MARLPKSNREKKVAGTLRKDRQRQTKSSKEVGDVAAEFALDEYGQRVYDRVKAYLEGNGMFQEVDSMLISQYAYFAQVFAIMCMRSSDYGSIIAMSDKGNEYMAVGYQVLSNARNQMGQLEKSLGIGPYFRQAIRGFDEDTQEDDPVKAVLMELAKN